ncbi:MAG: prepilin peptidase [Solirubrobacterales bacterium]
MTEGQEQLITAFALGGFGLIFGSFLAAVAYRLPRGQTPWEPKRSHCPSCNAEIRARDNIPVLSWILLRGKCRDCGESISWRYPFFEALTAILWSAVGAYHGLEPELLPDLLLITTLLVAANSDLDMRIIPNKLLFVSLLAGLIAQAWARPDDWLEWTVAGSAAFTGMFLVALAYPRGMGMGDVKLAGVMGIYLGRAIGPALLFAFFAGTLVGVAVMIRKGVAEGRKTAVPFGPFMAAGGILAVFWGEDVVEWYLDTFASG